MRLGIIGLPQSGKTTIFNALTRGKLPTVVGGGRLEINTGVVNVPDQRVERLVELFSPEKITHARVVYADITGLENGNSKQGLPGALLNQLSQVDALLHVVRCFDDPSIAHSLGNIDPQRDILTLDNELMLNDLLTVTRRIERLQQDLRHNSNGEKMRLESELTLFQRLQEALEGSIPLRDLQFTSIETKLLSGFGLLSLKPVLLVLNLSEGQKQPEIQYNHQYSQVVALQGKLEMELAQLSADEVEEFKGAYGITELGLESVIRLSYDLLGYQSFFTVGEDEVRAWNVRRGATALEASGVIHTDLQRGFIRAEVVDHEDLLELGGLSQARSHGKLRLEGKDYLLQDGEIMHVRFNA
jgi:GTP-binding protein YchF